MEKSKNVENEKLEKTVASKIGEYKNESIDR